MPDFRDYFKNKKVTVVGLGLLGKRLGDIAYLAECGAEVLVTDLKTASELAPSIKKLEKYSNIQYSLGGHKLEDFENKDFILKGQGVPLDSPYIAHARERGIPIEMDESLFAKLVEKENLDIKIIGVTGTRGKTTTTMLIYEILKNSGARVHLGGNIKGTAALPLLRKVKKGDVVVFELSSWQLQGFGEAKISPHIAVFTNFMPDHMNYYKNSLAAYLKDKSYIYKFQKKNDFLIIGPSLKGKLRGIKSRLSTASPAGIPKSWKIKLKGKHNLENMALAAEAVRVLGIPERVIKEAVENFRAIEGRLEPVKTFRGAEIYNDTNSTTPEAAIAALNSFDKKVIMIMGGMDKGLSVKKLKEVLPKRTKKVILIPGSGSDKITGSKIRLEKAADLEEAVNLAIKSAEKGDIILFSPGFASFNSFKNEYDRGEKFMKLINKLK